MSSLTTVTLVRSRAVLGEIIQDRNMAEDEIRIYRVDESGTVAFDIVLKIAKPEETSV